MSELLYTSQPLTVAQRALQVPALHGPTDYADLLGHGTIAARQTDDWPVMVPRRPLALLHANPDRAAWVRLRHFEHASDALFDRVIFPRAGWDDDDVILLAMRAVDRAAGAVRR